MQTTLFGAPAATNGFRDSSFAKNKNLPLHRWVPWVAGFSADFVDDAIRTYLPRTDSNCWVLDPFAGVGTTLVESYLSGINVIGFEINPYAALAVRLKLGALKISVHDLTRKIATFERFMEKAEDGSLKRGPHSQAPTGFSGRTQLFSPRVQRKVLYARLYQTMPRSSGKRCVRVLLEGQGRNVEVHHFGLNESLRVFLIIRIHALPKVPGLRSMFDARKRFARVARRDVNVGEIDHLFVKRIFECEIYADHRESP